VQSQEIIFHTILNHQQFPEWTARSEVVRFFHETMKPYHDSIEDIERALDYAFSTENGKGGFLLLAERAGKLTGALLMLNTGMKGYIPENILLFVTVAPDLRGQGLGRKIIQRALDECGGNVKLHVDYDNPAKRLYERMGFTTKYAEMRLIR